jgi:hypothetical protein
VTFGKGPHDHGFTCEIVAYVPQGRGAEGHRSRRPTPTPPSTAAAEKIEKQLRRYTAG